MAIQLSMATSPMVLRSAMGTKSACENSVDDDACTVAPSTAWSRQVSSVDSAWDSSSVMDDDAQARRRGSVDDDACTVAPSTSAWDSSSVIGDDAQASGLGSSDSEMCGASQGTEWPVDSSESEEEPDDDAILQISLAMQRYALLETALVGNAIQEFEIVKVGAPACGLDLSTFNDESDSEDEAAAQRMGAAVRRWAMSGTKKTQTGSVVS